MKDFKVYQASGYLTKLVTDASDVRKEYEEISGSLVQFNTPISAPLASLIVDINPVQSGSGTPSPDNVRPITGWTGANIYHSGEDTSNPTTYTVSWQDDSGTVYGGAVDITTGVLTVTMAIVDLGTLNWAYYVYSGKPGGYSSGLINVVKHVSDVHTKANAVCSALELMSDNGFNIQNTGANIAINAIGSVKVTVPNVTDTQSLTTALNGVQLVYELATPLEYQITPEEINTLIGVNNIWADTGDVSVKYRTH